MTDQRPTVLILRGLPASGKTTFASDLVTLGWTRVNKDDLRTMMHAGVYSFDNERLVLEARDAVILHTVMVRRRVVVDDTNIEPRHVDRIKKLVVGIADVRVHDMRTGVEECVRRDALRDKPVGEHVIRKMAERWEEVKDD